MTTLAQQAGLSARQLQRLLQQHFGISPIELAQTTRLLFAKKLLQETSLPMTELAFAAGFGSVRRFNALFLSRYGLAPGGLRRNSAGNDEITLRLAYRPPLAWNSLCDYLAARLIKGVEAITPTTQTYLRTVRLPHQQATLEGWISVSHLPQEHQLQVQVAASLTPVLMPLLARVRQLFDLDANPVSIEEHLIADPLMANQIRRTPGLRVAGAFEPFELAIRAVLGQQISVAGASTLAARLVRQFGTAVESPFPGLTHHFPYAAALAAIPVEQIASLGMPHSRAATIVAMAQFAAQGGLEMTPGTTLEQATAQMKMVRGIGEWTAQYIALRALRYPDAFPAGDLGLQKAAASDGVDKISQAQLLLQAQPWSPWRGYAALLLWQSLNHP